LAVAYATSATAFGDFDVLGIPPLLHVFYRAGQPPLNPQK